VRLREAVRYGIGRNGWRSGVRRCPSPVAVCRRGTPRAAPVGPLGEAPRHEIRNHPQHRISASPLDIYFFRGYAMEQNKDGKGGTRQDTRNTPNGALKPLETADPAPGAVWAPGPQRQPVAGTAGLYTTAAPSTTQRSTTNA